MLTLLDFSISRNNRKLFENINITILPRAVLCIHGSNGLGKTSVLKALATIAAWSGQLLFNHCDVKQSLSEYLSLVMYIGHQNALDYDLTVLQNLRFWAQMKNMPNALEAAVSFFGLEPYLLSDVKKLSQGWQRKVEFTKLLLTQSTVWFLDEPFVNLDTDGKHKLFELIEVRAMNFGIVILTAQEALYHPTIDIINFALNDWAL